MDKPTPRHEYEVTLRYTSGTKKGSSIRVKIIASSETIAKRGAKFKNKGTKVIYCKKLS